jgi:hypothetical protein
LEVADELTAIGRGEADPPSPLTGALTRPREAQELSWPVEDALRVLEADGVISRTVQAVVPPHVTYT